MKVHLTFDVEVWCNGWRHLDQQFPAAFERYVVGRSRHGDYALPETLATLRRHGLRGVFFVEPLFAARFGTQYLRRIVRMIGDAGHDVQLHLHPEWADEIRPLPIAGATHKRQYLCQYSRDEQTRLIGFALRLLRDETAAPVVAFRAGSYAANLDTYAALAANGIGIDSSLNRLFAVSGADVPVTADAGSAGTVGPVLTFPVTVFTDGLGRLRPAQVGACGGAEMQQALDRAAAAGRGHFVIVSHNFEMLRPDRSDPDRIVVRRFDRLCRHLAAHPGRFDVCALPPQPQADAASAMPSASPWATLWRLGEQAARRLQ